MTTVLSKPGSSAITLQINTGRVREYLVGQGRYGRGPASTYQHISSQKMLVEEEIKDRTRQGRVRLLAMYKVFLHRRLKKSTPSPSVFAASNQTM
ncbi:hypothetical protein PHSY_001482 [Pseudozyma hubeiensis SY62]|uniref:Uncharacterized protein n=1 Tax=Pseudozyma hubeiensis (strain SY62) TaxID=1305764 RepID=R9NYV5_PSEHS|nr:hypothetical protein PHSY_001482 [Pseudozyma hubeiensis SY62]GAC93914.1 hypothetical protein PHSY_001482 [Pseudozyma hubeiensis SY62]